ncbi:GNAT family N-acetyltransferase [uncultured Bacteroides sp.]|uniref:GNAT family N-acetyltransferase n=1 Tax=uncultured Bacteroides sp. TaxID=162156 RepID=UPI0026757C3B|nr:GNAT family N-acetyltransferase [uncultured Bacteroides sp.]
MIRLQPIHTSDVSHYKFMEDLLINSFPPEEYRQLEELREYTDRTDNFHNNIIFDDHLPVGFITYWDFENFYYVEHFATDPALRNGGYGKRTLEFLCKELTLPIVLEVERPIEEMAQRRINFYQRQGFTLWEKDYHQPPYKPGDDFLPMYLMVHGSLDPEKDYEDIRHKLHTVVYGVKE